MSSGIKCRVKINAGHRVYLLGIPLQTNHPINQSTQPFSVLCHTCRTRRNLIAYFSDPTNIKVSQVQSHTQNLLYNENNYLLLHKDITQEPNDCPKKIIINRTKNPSERIRKLSDDIAKLL